MDVTHLNRGAPGLSEAQLARLVALERSSKITQLQAGEAQFYRTQGTPEQQERALRVVGRAVK